MGLDKGLSSAVSPENPLTLKSKSAMNTENLVAHFSLTIISLGLTKKEFGHG
jgi:hypothetical protein